MQVTTPPTQQQSNFVYFPAELFPVELAVIPAKRCHPEEGVAATEGALVLRVLEQTIDTPAMKHMVAFRKQPQRLPIVELLVADQAFLRQVMEDGVGGKRPLALREDDQRDSLQLMVVGHLVFLRPVVEIFVRLHCLLVFGRKMVSLKERRSKFNFLKGELEGGSTKLFAFVGSYFVTG